MGIVRRQVMGRIIVTVLLVQWSGLPSTVAAQQQGTTSETVIEAPAPVELKLEELARQPGKSELRQLAEKLEKLFNALDEAQGRIPRATFDPNVIVNGQPEVEFEGVGKDPVKLFEWVRDNTYLVPYRGVLRDSRGVLMDRVGNSLDRALLLFALLRTAGHKKIRMAYAELSEEKATELLETARPIPDEGALPRQKIGPDDLAARLKKYARQYDLDPAELRKVTDETNRKSQGLAEEAAQRTVEQSQILIEMLREKDLIPSREEQMERLRMDAIKAVKHHWWVQWQSDAGGGGLIGGGGGGGKTIDLDPSLPDAEPGKPFVGMQKVVPGSELTENLQNEMHTVQIRLVIERWEDGKLVEFPVLTQRLFPAAFIGERIAIHHAPAPGNWPEDLNLFEEERPLERLKEVVLGQREWIPVLSVGEHRISKFGFTDEGEITDPTLPGFVQSALAGRELAEGMEQGVQALGERVLGKLARVEKYDPGPSRPEENNEQLKTDTPRGRAQLTAEWIEYEIHVRGQEPQVIRRQIFDLVGPAARASARQAGQADALLPAPILNAHDRLNRGLALLGQTEILPTVGQLSPEFAAHIQMQSLRANRELLLSMFRTPRLDGLSALTEQAVNLSPVVGYLYSLALSRKLWAPQRGDIYFDEPNIISFHQYMRNNSRNELLARQAFDIVNNQIAISSSSSVNHFVARLEQGVLDTNAEALLLTDLKNSESVAELLEAARAQGVNWLVVKEGVDLDLETAHLSEDLHARIHQDLSEGYAIVSPKSAIDIGDRREFSWWRVNPNTGHCLGIGEQGWGTTGTERKMTEAQKAFRLFHGPTAGTFLCGVAIGTDANKLTEIDIAICLISGALAGAGVYLQLLSSATITAIDLTLFIGMAGSLIAGLGARK